MATGNWKSFWFQSFGVVSGYFIVEVFFIEKYSLLDIVVTISIIEITLLILNFFGKIKMIFGNLK